MSLLTAAIVKNGHNMAATYFIFLKSMSYTTLERLSIPNLDLSEKIGKTIIK